MSTFPSPSPLYRIRPSVSDTSVVTMLEGVLGMLESFEGLIWKITLVEDSGPSAILTPNDSLSFLGSGSVIVCRSRGSDRIGEWSRLGCVQN